MTVVERRQWWCSLRLYCGEFMMEALVVIVESMASVGKLELESDDVGIIMKALR